MDNKITLAGRETAEVLTNLLAAARISGQRGDNAYKDIDAEEFISYYYSRSGRDKKDADPLILTALRNLTEMVNDAYAQGRREASILC